LSKLSLTAPDWPPALLRGFAIGALGAGVLSAAQLVATRALWRGSSFPEILTFNAPWLTALANIGGALIMAILAFFVGHLLLKFTKRPWIAIVVPGVIVALMGLQPALRSWVLTLEQGVIFSILCWTVWRYGFLTAAVAVWVAELLSAAMALLAVGNDVYLTSGSVCVVALVAVPGLALLARRRTAVAQ
jgi:hypothetical protein